MIGRWLLGALLAVMVVGCREKDTNEGKSEVRVTETKDAASTPAPRIFIPSVADFEAKAMTEIDETNYERELSKLERALK